MSRDSRYDILFEPLQIGPVTTKNRFYQVPHCTGMGWQRPNSLNEMRGIKAEGGWGVVNSSYRRLRSPGAHCVSRVFRQTLHIGARR